MFFLDFLKKFLFTLQDFFLPSFDAVDKRKREIFGWSTWKLGVMIINRIRIMLNCRTVMSFHNNSH